MGDTKEKKKEKNKKCDEEMEFLRKLNIAEDLEKAGIELEDTYREF